MKTSVLFILSWLGATALADKPIIRLPDGSYCITPAAADANFRNLNQVLQSGSAVFSFEGTGPMAVFSGFEIRALEKNSVFRELGLKVGDIVKSWDGVNLANPATVCESFGRSASRHRLTTAKPTN